VQLQKIVSAALVAAALGGAGGALAATSVSNDLTVKLTIDGTCSVAPAILTFNNPGNLASDVFAEQDVLVNCTSGIGYSVGFGGGSYMVGAQRRMKHANSNNFITYEIFQDQARSIPLAMTGAGLVTGKLGDGTDQPVTVYGRVEAQQAPSIGEYTDTVHVTVTY